MPTGYFGNYIAPNPTPQYYSQAGGYGSTVGGTSTSQAGAPTQQQTQIASLMQQLSQQAGGYTQAQARADSAGLVAAAQRTFLNSIMPQINQASQDAGASGGALTALMTNEAAAAQAGQVAQVQLGQILGAAQDQTARRGQSLNGLGQLLQALNQQSSTQAQYQLGQLQAQTGLQQAQIGATSGLQQAQLAAQTSRANNADTNATSLRIAKLQAGLKAASSAARTPLYQLRF